MTIVEILRVGVRVSTLSWSDRDPVQIRGPHPLGDDFLRRFIFVSFFVLILSSFAWASPVDPTYDNFDIFGSSSREFVRAPLPFSSYALSYYKSNDAYHSATFSATEVAAHGRVDGSTFSDYHSYSASRNLGVSNFLLAPTSVRGSYNATFDFSSEGTYFICLGQCVDVSGSFANPCSDFFSPGSVVVYFEDPELAPVYCPGSVFFDSQYYWTVWAIDILPYQKISSISYNVVDSFVSSFGFRDVTFATADLKINVLMDAYFAPSSSSSSDVDLESFISYFTQVNSYYMINGSGNRFQTTGNFFKNIRDGFQSIINLLFDPVGDELKDAASSSGLPDTVIDVYQESSSNISSGRSFISSIVSSLSSFDLGSAFSAAGFSNFSTLPLSFWSNAVKNDIQLQ